MAKPTLQQLLTQLQTIDENREQVTRQISEVQVPTMQTVLDTLASKPITEIIPTLTDLANAMTDNRQNLLANLLTYVQEIQNQYTAEIAALSQTTPTT